mmetsp:Transcript_32978/g.52834  ORF Transcript_32978/g.52834 Transcript_32978/m.52834 type:complete len:80 (-) Transcript_32978:231-470(-)
MDRPIIRKKTIMPQTKTETTVSDQQYKQKQTQKQNAHVEKQWFAEILHGAAVREITLNNNNNKKQEIYNNILRTQPTTK